MKNNMTSLQRPAILDQAPQRSIIWSLEPDTQLKMTPASEAKYRVVLFDDNLETGALPIPDQPESNRLPLLMVGLLFTVGFAALVYLGKVQF